MKCFQITGQKQRLNGISFHIFVSILVLCHAYSTFTNFRNLHHAIYDFGSARVLITDQCSSRLFNCNIATSKIFEYRPVNSRTMRYAAICVLSGNVAFGQNFIPHVDTCQSAMKGLTTINNRVLVLSKHQSAVSLECIILSGMIRYLSGKLAIFVEFRYSLSVFPGETQVLPGVIIVEIYRSKPETKQSKKQTVLNIFNHSRPSFYIVTNLVNGVIQFVSQ